MKHLKIDDDCEGLSVSRGGNERRWMSKSNRFDKSRFKFFTCQKTNYFMRYCHERRGNDYSIEIALASDEDSYESVSAL